MLAKHSHRMITELGDRTYRTNWAHRTHGTHGPLEPKEPIGLIESVEPTRPVRPKGPTESAQPVKPKELLSPRNPPTNQWNSMNIHWTSLTPSNSRSPAWRMSNNISKQIALDIIQFLGTHAWSQRHFNAFLKVLRISIFMHARCHVIHGPNNVSSET